MDFRNGTNFEFSDISSEQYREYVFPGGDCIRITKPLKLHVSESGGHRIFSGDGTSYYIPAGWIMLSWKVFDDRPHFDF